jgi:hypothetical protein
MSRILALQKVAKSFRIMLTRGGKGISVPDVGGAGLQRIIKERVTFEKRGNIISSCEEGMT